MSADRRFKITFLAVVLAALVGFGSWYGFVREDGVEVETAQDAIEQDALPGDGIARDEAASGAQAVLPTEPGQERVDASVGTPVAVEPESVEQLPEGAAPAGEAGAGSDIESEVEIAAVDPSREKPAASESATAVPAPVFDIVRVEPSGDAVIAGRSFPGAVVELVRNGVVHDRIVADASGAFAFIPPPFPAGASEVVLRIVGADGTPRQSEQSVTVVVADDLLTTPMVAIVAPNQPTVVLSRPEERAVEVAAAEAAAAEISIEEADVAEASSDEIAPADRQQVAAADATAYPNADSIRIASVEAETGGGLYVTGEATPNASVRLYLNDTFVAPAEAGADGTVSFSIERGVRPGSYRVRLDQVTGETGSVLSRAEIVFIVPDLLPELVAEAPAAQEATPERAASTIVPEISTAVVERGDSLWRISRQVYGSGMRYTEIFEANQNQIRNPNLIFPGQLFVLPADPERPAAPEQSVN